MSSCHHATIIVENKPIISDSLAKMIQYDTADFESIRNELKVTGEIDYNENNVVKIFPFSSGQVIQVLVSQGEMVTSGQTLAIIRSAEVAGNYQDLSSAFNDLAIAKKQYENSNSLFNNGISSEREYLESKENYNKALAIVEKIRGSIDINGKGNTTSNGTYVIKAPKSGYIIEKKIFEGGYIRSDNTDYLFVIGDIRDVWVWANIYETDIAKIHEGDTALVSTLAYDGQVFKGVVDKMNQQLDPISKVLKIRIRLANDSVLLKPEMFASITVSSHSRQKALCISDQCLIFENGKVYVVVYHDNTNVEVKQVEVLYSSYGKAYIKSGLSEGERIISKFQLLLFDELTDN